MSITFLVEMELDGGTERFSFDGVTTADKYWKPYLTGVGTIERGIEMLPGELETVSLELRFKNSDNYFSMLRASEPLYHRTVNLLMGDDALGFGNFGAIFTGIITNWSLTSEAFRVEVSDLLCGCLDAPVKGRITGLEFPHIPEETSEAAMMPLVIGKVSSEDFSALGALPAYLIDPAVGQSKYRYLLAQVQLKEVTNAYLYGVKIDPANYTVTYQTSPERTYLDFDSDQRDPDRAFEREITYDAIGLTDDGTPTGGTLANPVRQLEQFLLRNGFQSSDLDSNSFDSTADVAAARGLLGGFAVTQTSKTVREVIAEFAESFNLGIFFSRTGKVAVSYPQVGDTSAALVAVDDQRYVIRQSFSAVGIVEKASMIVANFALNRVTEEWEAATELEDLLQTGRLNALEPVRIEANLRHVRDLSTAVAVIEDRLFFLREERQAVTVRVDPALWNQIEIGDDIRLTHFAGIVTDGRGYQDTAFRVLRVGLDIEARRTMLRLDLVDLTEAAFSTAKEFTRQVGALMYQTTDPNAWPSFGVPWSHGVVTEAGLLDD